MKKYFLLALLLSGLTITVSAETLQPLRRPTLSDSIAQLGKQYLARLSTLREDLESNSLPPRDLLDNPYYFPLFAAPTFYRFPLQQRVGTLENSGSNYEVANHVADALLSLYARHPELVVYNLTQASTQVSPPIADVPRPAQPPRPPKPQTTVETALQEKERVDLAVRKPNFWTVASNFSFQFMQYHVSENWHKGGENHNSFLATINLEANYDDKEDFSFANKLEMRLGFQSSNSDTRHRYKTNSDLLRLTNKFGLRATQKWYYTIMLQTWTQFYKGYKANDPNVYSDFLSPLESVLSLGMDYKHSAKRFNLTATMSPLAINFKYVDRLHLSPRYGLEKDKHARVDFGSSITVGTKWNITPDIQWGSRLFAFTNYSRVQAEWENTVTFKVNKYLSAKLFLYPRFDDGVKRVKDMSYFQFNEYLSIGFDYAL